MKSAGEHIAIIGAGLVGGVQACYMAQKGYKVSVYERRGDIRKAELVGGRSINLALSERGWKALDEIGLKKEVEKLAIPMTGRMIHDVAGNLDFQPYSKDGKAIYSVSRGGLNQVLLRHADTYDNLELHFDQKCRDINLETNTISFRHSKSGEITDQSFDKILGTDGAFSRVRLRLQKTDRFNYSQEYLTHGYKELVIPPNEDGTHKMQVNALHIWPRGEFMVIALPNLDGSYTVTLFFPFEGKTSFDSIKTKADVKTFFDTYFPDAVPLMPTLLEDYFSNPTSSLVMVTCDPWHYEDKVCLLGDAAHAIVPFYGQGMNSGFEDCSEFSRLLDAHEGDWLSFFKRFSKERKPAADAILELAVRNYIEMRDLTADPRFVLQKKIEKLFSKKHPSKWMPLYEQVTFSHIPYHDALKRGEEQNAIMQKVMDRNDIREVWDSREIEQAILKELESLH